MSSFRPIIFLSDFAVQEMKWACQASGHLDLIFANGKKFYLMMEASEKVAESTHKISGYQGEN